VEDFRIKRVEQVDNEFKSPNFTVEISKNLDFTDEFFG